MIEHCKRCDLCLQNDFKPPIPKGSLTGSILIIIDIYNAKQINEIEQAMYVAGFYPSDYYITSLVKCKSKTTVYELYYQKCKVYLDMALQLPFKVVLLFGSRVYQSVFNTIPMSFKNAIHRALFYNNKYIITTYSMYMTVYKNDYKMFAKVFELLDEFYRLKIDLNHTNNVDKILKYKVSINSNNKKKST